MEPFSFPSSLFLTHAHILNDIPPNSRLQQEQKKMWWEERTVPSGQKQKKENLYGFDSDSDNSCFSSDDSLDDDEDPFDLKEAKDKILKLGLLFLAEIISDNEFETAFKKTVNRSASKKRNREDVEKRMADLSDTLFKRMYRFDRPTFDWLLLQIKPKIENTDGGKAFARMTCGSEVTPTIKLAVTLRMLAGGSYLDISFGYGIAPSTVYTIFHEVCEAIDECIDNIKFPYNDIEALKKLERTFDKFGGDFALPGTVAAGDGVVFQIQKPVSADVEGNVEAFWSRKGFYGFGMQGFVDGDTKFVCISSEVCTSNHDSTAYLATPIYRILHPTNGGPSLLPSQFHLVLDAAYTAGPQEHTPWKGKNLPQWKDVYNYYLSLKRQCVERAFGLLVSRWGILWRPMRFSIERTSRIIRVVCKLHNVCVDSFKKETFVAYHEDMHWVLRPSLDIPVTYPVWTDGTGRSTGRGYRTDLENCPGRAEATEEIQRVFTEEQVFDRNKATTLLRMIKAARPTKIERLSDKPREKKRKRRGGLAKRW